MKELGTEQLCKGKKVVLFAVPGAFTPTCSMKHLPGFIERAEEIKVGWGGGEAGGGCVCNNASANACVGGGGPGGIATPLMGLVACLQYNSLCDSHAVRLVWVILPYHNVWQTQWCGADQTRNIAPLCRCP